MLGERGPSSQMVIVPPSTSACALHHRWNWRPCTTTSEHLL